MARTTPLTRPSQPARKQQDTPFWVSAIRVGYRVLGALAPGLAGRFATNHFLSTRAQGARQMDTVPLGARRIPIDGNPAVSHGYVWGSDGPTVLLVHGWGADSSSMYSLTTPLVKQGFRVVAFDAPAHGVSPGKRTTMMEFVRAIGHAMDSLGDVHAIVGHSLGCVASVAATARRTTGGPQRLVLISAPSSLPEVIGKWSGYLHIGPGVVARMRKNLKHLNGVPVDHWDIPELGRNLEVPVMVVHDRDDLIVSFNEAEKIADALRDTQLRSTSGLGHRRILFDRAVHADIAQFLEPAFLETRQPVSAAAI